MSPRLAVVVLLALALFACGGGSSAEPAEEGSANAESAGAEEAAPSSAQAELLASMQLPPGPDGTVLCTLADGAVRLALPMPPDFLGLSIEGRCHLTTEDERSTTMVDAIAVGDGGPEQLLAAEPDGVRRWLSAGFAPEAQPVSDAPISLAGGATRAYWLTLPLGEPPAPAQMLAVRRTLGDHHVVVIVFLKEGARWSATDAEAWVAGIRAAP